MRIERQLNIRTMDIEGRVERYRLFAIILAILVHALVFTTWMTVFSISSLPPQGLIAVHLTAQGLALLNILLGPPYYRRHLMKKAKRLDILVLNRYT